MKLRALRWQFGSILPPEVKINICEPESEWFNAYSKNLATYMRSVGDGIGLDLTQDLHPPKQLYIEVRCLTDYGDFDTECGETILLKKGSQYLLPRSECEHLIHQGVLEHVI